MALVEDRAVPFVHMFETERFKYAYDINTARVLRVNPIIYSLLSHWDWADNRIGAMLNEQEERVSAARTTVLKLSAENEYFSTKRPLSIDTFHTRRRIEKKLETECRQMTLGVSEQCNMRCAYCPYTGNSPGERRHSAKLMSWETARAAIDFFVDHCSGTWDEYYRQRAEIKGGRIIKRMDLMNRPCIGFYGGEPLINWPVIKRAIEYIRALPRGHEYHINMTTNGTLLEPRIVDFLARKQVALLVSLDGPRAYHDRYRRMANGEATFDLIASRLSYIHDTYPEYYDRQVGLMMVVAPPADWLKLLEFELTWELMPERPSTFTVIGEMTPRSFWDQVPQGSAIANADLMWQQYCDEIIRGNIPYRPEIFDKKEYRKIAFLRSMWDVQLLTVYGRTRNILGGSTQVPDRVHTHFGMCLPGELRIFVTADGRFLPCERVPSEAQAFQIGDVSSGFNFNAIGRLCKENAHKVEQLCLSCWNLRTCHIKCNSIVGADGRLSRSARLRACKKSKEATNALFVRMCSLLEQEPEALKFLDEI